MAGMGWIGFDFDGTLATHRSGQQELGEPVPNMVALAKQYLAQGYEIRIVTARATHPVWRSEIRDWCFKHLGVMVEVTNQKDWDMLLLYDDRAIAVESNTGRTAGFRL
jgi:FMN phosphatase YigB (HAD superfamily)